MNEDNIKKLFGEIETDFPIRYDSRMEIKRKEISPFPKEYKVGFDTPVKSQFTSNCWAFSLAEVFQSYLLRNKMIELSDDYADLSECHITYDVFDVGRQNNGKSTNPNGVMPKLNDSTKKYSYGGTIYTILSYLARGGGVCEKIDPCPPRLNDNLIDRNYPITYNKPKKYYAKSIKMLNNPPDSVTPPYTQFISDIKFCLMSYSEVSISMYYSKDYVAITISSGKKIENYFSIPDSDMPTSARDNGGRHRITIVGWDDNYPASNFKSAVGVSQKTYTVQKNGAFLIKNSWGTTSQWDGYFWMSYEDYNIRNAFCITDVTDFNNKPYKIYGSPFAMNAIMDTSIPGYQTESINFGVTYTTKIDNETLSAIGVFCVSPTIVTVELTIAGNAKDIISRVPIYDAGYHVIDLDSPEIIPKANTDFELTCYYEAMKYGQVFVPIEYRHVYSSSGKKIEVYPNIVLNPSCEVNGMLVSDINKNYNKRYGNVALYAIMQSESGSCAAIKEAYDNITVPDITENRIDELVQQYKDKNGTTVSVEWRLEPADAEKYIPNYKKPTIQQYKTSQCVGIINTSNKNDVNAILNCIIGEKEASGWQMSKTFSVTVPHGGSSYSFTVSGIYNGYQADVYGGNVPPGSTVEVSANNSKVTLTADANGEWYAHDFPLYTVNLEKKEGWKDSYKNTIVSVTVKDDSNFQIISGKSSSVKLEKPYESSVETGIIIVSVIVGFGLIGLACAMAYSRESEEAAAGGKGVKTLIGESLLDLTDAPSMSSLPSEEFTFAGDFTELSFESTAKSGTTIITDRPIFESVKNIKGIHLETKMKLESNNNVANKNNNIGILANTVAKGGCIEDCSIKGNIEDKTASNIGGLFYKGEDVTIKNCTCSLTVQGASSYGGIAHTLTGNSNVTNCEITGNASARDMIAGVAVNLNGGTISDTFVSGTLSAKTAAGIASVMSGGTIKNCMSACKLSATENGYGIASGIENNTACISHCISVCSHIGGNQPAIVSKYKGTNNITYQGIHCDKGKTFIDDGTISKSWYEFGKKQLYTDMGWDTEKVWEFSDTMMYLRLKGSKMPYYYPFFIVAQTQNGIYKVKIGKELILTGSKNGNMSQIKWTGISPQNGFRSSKENYWTENDVFVMTVPIQFTQSGDFNLFLSGDLEEDNYLLDLPITVVE